ncbi:hypothetical protein CDL12_16775 [Handroanthus impetiginosus]|uniref:Survival Motor Neuron Gemin2-binding domain-containing protein n=1 Tax=Handroanthus impetiginosus TaxID=429701 RepID=A0A2G9GZC8_9LAMI|nr:hypothetical protein CDL12_16775 [Handroanthus impetiginosus]
MGKEGDLWDDSALIKAFDSAISKYKTMHGMSGSTAEDEAITNTEENLPAARAGNGSNEFHYDAERHVQNDGNLYAAEESTAKIGETANSLEIKENSDLESAKCVGSSNTQNGKLLSSSEDPADKSVSSGKHQISSEGKGQNESTWYSNDPEEYSQLLNKYYELEAQRQNILQQLNQYSN